MLRSSRPGRVVAQACLILLVALGVFAHAQTAVDGAIGGTVLDSSGALVSSATIDVVNESTNAHSTATADDQGFFRVIHLQPATYTVTVTASGFSEFKAEHTVVSVGSLTTIEPHLN